MHLCGMRGPALPGEGFAKSDPEASRGYLVTFKSVERALSEAPTKGKCVVANERHDANPSCAKCGTTMKDVVTIVPVAGEPGLIGYECPNCGCVTSEILPPHQSNGHELLP